MPLPPCALRGEITAPGCQAGVPRTHPTRGPGVAFCAQVRQGSAERPAGMHMASLEISLCSLVPLCLQDHIQREDGECPGV